MNMLCRRWHGLAGDATGYQGALRSPPDSALPQNAGVFWPSVCHIATARPYVGRLLTREPTDRHDNQIADPAVADLNPGGSTHVVSTRCEYFSLDTAAAARKEGVEMAKRKKLFITGAAGTVGTALRKHLRDRFDYRLLFHSTVPQDVGSADEVVVSDVSSFEAMLEASEGVDVIVHLALARTRREMPRAQRAQLTFEVDMKGTYNLLEAARINGISTVVFASTNHVTGMNEKAGIRSHPAMPLRPDGLYGAGKAFGEALGRYYVDGHGLRVFCLRIANFNGRDEPGRLYEPGQSRWLSPRDLAQLVWRCIEATDLQWGIFYGVSKGGEQKWDLSNAKELLGYDPQDDGSATEHRIKYAPTQGR